MPGVMIFAAGFVTNELFYRESERDSRHDFLSFTMAANNGYRDENGDWQQTSTLWLNVKAFGALARNGRGAIAKGRPVMVHGELKHETFDGADGHKHSSLDLKADSIGLNLQLCSTHYNGPGERYRELANTADVRRGGTGDNGTGEGRPGGIGTGESGTGESGTGESGTGESGAVDGKLGDAVLGGADLVGGNGVPDPAAFRAPAGAGAPDF